MTKPNGTTRAQKPVSQAGDTASATGIIVGRSRYRCTTTLTWQMAAAEDLRGSSKLARFDKFVNALGAM